jgi:hypothetical protein
MKLPAAVSFILAIGAIGFLPSSALAQPAATYTQGL